MSRIFSRSDESDIVTKRSEQCCAAALGQFSTTDETRRGKSTPCENNHATDGNSSSNLRRIRKTNAGLKKFLTSTLKRHELMDNRRKIGSQQRPMVQ